MAHQNDVSKNINIGALDVRAFIISIVALFVINGCATYPKEKTTFDLPASANIGLIIMIEPKATHLHIGSTMFNNFKEKHNVKWNLFDYVNGKIQSRISSTRHKVLKIEPSDYQRDTLSDIYSIGWDRANLDKKAAAVFKKIGSQHGLDAIIIVQTYSDHNIGGRGILPMSIDGYGLYTESLFGMYQAYAYAHISGAVVYAKNPAFMSYFKSKNTPEIKHINFPSNIKHIDQNEFDKVEPYVKSLVDEVILSIFEEANLK